MGYSALTRVRVAFLTTLAGTASFADAQALAVPTRDATPDAYLYINYATGERIVSRSLAPDGNLTPDTYWSWSARSPDPCTPSGYGGAPSIPVFNAVHDEALGDAEQADAIGLWHDWFEHPGDTVIDSVLISTFVQIPDTDHDGDGIGDGIDGLDWFFTFTENDDPDNRDHAIAHSPILVSSLPGSLDIGSAAGDVAGDGVIGFGEGQYLVTLLDFTAGDSPTDIEIGDLNGVSDGFFGTDSIYSGIPGVDTDGDGLVNSGFVVGFRQPGVVEGDGLIARFPELAGLGLEDIDGSTPDPSTFPNIRPVGFALAAPSDDITSYQDRTVGQIDWPYNPAYMPEIPEGIGAVDGYTRIDADGVDRGLKSAGLFACDPGATSPPFYTSPWITCEIRFNAAIIVEDCFSTACNPVDCFAEPYGVIDLADIVGFITAFQNGEDIADFAPPFGVLDLADLSAFVIMFQAGCP